MTGAHKSIYSRDKFANKLFIVYIALCIMSSGSMNLESSLFSADYTMR